MTKLMFSAWIHPKILKPYEIAWLSLEENADIWTLCPSIWLYIHIPLTFQVKSHQKNIFILSTPTGKFALVMHWAWYATAASHFVQSYSTCTWCKQLLQQSLLSLQHTDTYTIWARFRGFSGWSGNIGCKGSRLEAQLKDLLSALVSFLAGDFWEEQGR